MGRYRTIPAFFLSVLLLSGEAWTSQGPSIAVFPFKDLSREVLDPSVSSVIQAELAKAGLEVVPVKVIMEEIMEVGPQAIWKDGNEEGVLLEIERRREREARSPLGVDILVYGDQVRFGRTVRINIYLKRRKEKGLEGVFTVEGGEEELLKGLRSVSREIARFILSREAVRKGEEYIRGYKGGLYTYEATLQALRGLVEEWGSFPLRVLYLSMLLEREEEKEEEIIKEGERVLEAFSPIREEDLRFLLSMGLDPFDIIATIKEKRKDIEKAIEIREKALKLFPLNQGKHRIALGRDYYLLALSLEKEGNREGARELYKKALRFLPPTEDEYRRASEGLKRLKP